MQLYERDFLLYQIYTGYLNINLKGNKMRINIAPSLDILYEASEVYYNTYNKAKNDGILDEREIKDFLFEQGLWDDEQEKLIETDIPNYLENIKVEMYKNYTDNEFLEKSRTYMEKANEKFYTLFNIRHSWDHITCHGVANYSRWQFLVENCSMINGKSVYMNTIEIADVLESINMSRLGDSKIRELSRTEPWRTTWYSGKKFQLFGKPAVEYSEDQKKLVYWSLLYDNIYENHECPPDEVVDNDDILDGWMIIKRRNQIAEKKKSYLEDKIGNNKNAGEIYVVAKNERERNDILELNDILSTNIIKNRINSIRKHGDMGEHEFSDVQQERAMNSARAESTMIRTRK